MLASCSYKPVVDTAGRLQANTQLMVELAKVKRVLSKIDSTAPHEVILVLDASTGQNAIRQVNVFDEALGLTGLVLTKLDGSAKAGFLFPLARQLSESGRIPLPIYYVGLGEGITVVVSFDSGIAVPCTSNISSLRIRSAQLFACSFEINCSTGTS